MKEKKTIIICDDDMTDIKLFKKYLGSEKLIRYNILEANNAIDLSVLINNKEQDVDLIFLDFYLGAERGIDLLKEIRKSNKAPVIMLTGRGDEEIAVECMKEGAVDYISKDTLPDIDIPKAIQQAIDKWEIEMERNQLLGIAAHELRNPIAVILGYTEMLQTFQDIETKQRNEMINIIHERSNHLLNIINELLDVTRIDKGIIVLKKKKVDVVSLVKKKTSDYKFLAEKKNIAINFSCSLDSFDCLIDPDRIEEVLSNFIDNAIKYSPRDTAIDIAVLLKDDRVEIRIKDQGLGIKENELKFLFELFSSKKISTLPTGQESRTGIGLAICKKVIDAHNGQVFVESKVGVGTIFDIILPINSQKDPSTFLVAPIMNSTNKY
jgi:signal transduction histidine kinase